MKRQKHNARAISTCILVTTAALMQGCAPTKNVSITSTPDKAHLTFYKISAEGGEPQPLPDASDVVTPANVTLDFTNQVHYRVEAHRVLCMPAPDTEILMDPQMSYNIQLTQYKTYVPAIVNIPTKMGEVWQLKPTPVQTVATMDPTEAVSAYIDQPTPITKNKVLNVDYPSFDSSPTTSLLVYEMIQPDSSSPSGYSSKLYRLPLAAGESPVQLTLGRKQQRFPTFDFSGDNIIFDSNDDSRSDSPFEFKTNENESSITHLEEIADNLEFHFSVGKDNIAFAGYSPNATEPQVWAASRDGSGPTPRAAGLSPQLSPDGNSIVYIHKPSADGKYRINIVNARGPIISHELVQNDDANFYDPHWSPDGALIVCSSPSRGKDQPDDVKKEPDPKYHDAEGEHSFLWLVTADGQHSLRLTKNESFDSNPVFDRNGRTIYFRSNRGGVWNIWKLNLTDAAFAELKATPPAQ
jgi:Tol biopolymer transport system component